MNAAVEITPWARILRIRQAVHDAGHSLCLERPRLWLAFRQSRKGKSLRHAPIDLQRAQAIAWIMQHRQPRIYEDELILGNMTSKRVAANYYFEGSSINILEDWMRLKNRVVPLDLSWREQAELLYLATMTAKDSVLYHALIRPLRLRHLWEMTHAERYIVTEQAGVAHQIGNYGRLVQYGLKAADDMAQQCLLQGQSPEGHHLTPEQIAFYQGQRIIIAGICRMANNLADYAHAMAYLPTTSAERREELLNSEQALRHVPYHPARNFQEGLQAVWLLHVAMCLEDFEQGLSFGRLDQTLKSLYDHDRASGALSYARAVELVASFQLKCCETMPVYSTRMDHYFSGHDVAQGITLGGVDADGNDVTHELSGVFLDAHALIATREPALHVRIHEATPAWFMDKCVTTLQQTGARPAFFGDNTIIPAMLHAGYSQEHARDYAVIGCTELGSQGRTYNSADAALMNLPLCLEQALNEGMNFNGKRQGTRTRPVVQMQSMEEVVHAFKLQVQQAVDDMAEVMGWLETAIRLHRTTPVNSLMTDGCMLSGHDVTRGGAMYNFTSVQAVGLADAGDALHAIDELVFQQQRYTLAELVHILRQDYAGHESLAIEMQRKLPRYGNGQPHADRWVQIAADVFTEAVSTHRNSRGGIWLAGFYSMTCGHAFGRYTGALANGRRAGMRLSNGCSPADGADRQGPSALFRSVASLDKSKWCNSQVLNATFDRKTIGGQSGAQKLASLLRTYFVDQQGMQVQIAILNADDLRKARENPQDYPNLLVRVSGYCAYFADLQPEIQDEIIARTMHG